MKVELPPSYNPKDVEDKWYKIWQEQKLFEPSFDPNKPKFSMVIPPPNVTGFLHIGHALNNTIQDVLARYKRMDGYDVLWIPGTDHAGIATQNVVERELAKEGLSREKLGKEKFLERVWQWKEKYGHRIIEQLKKLGASCSWSFKRFTMDEGLSKAVREVFYRLWNEGLIYRGDYIINWCPRCHTALADLEVEFENKASKLWYLKYPLEDNSGFILVATTRPETMLGDTAVAVHPEDERYKALIGKYVILPLIKRKIPIIADKSVDPEFGTGAVKITPAHDFNDFEIAKRHKLPFVKVIDESGKMTEEAGSYAGLDRFEARLKVLEDLSKENFLVKEEDYDLVVGHCYRCHTIIEPLLSKQWFVKMKPLAQPGIAAVEYGFIQFYPESWKNLYFDWMRNIRDWCISRQIWWGHRIPVWYCNSCGETVVSREENLSICPKCEKENLIPEEDVLDTWFSSALWPFSTMGWPDHTETLKNFYPTSVLVTSFDIIYFWVARMIMMGLHFMGAIPFKKVYIHALVRDEKGQKMSKSKGNVIDPIEMIDKFGCDALRFTLIALAAQGRDIKLSIQRIEGYKHFINKIWNAGRFVLMNFEGLEEKEVKNLDFNSLPLFSKWILFRLDETIKKVREKLEIMEFDQAAMALYHFFWDEFCDWYVEISKVYLKNPLLKKATQAVLYLVFCETLKLLHPFIPFITEELWNCLPFRETDYLIKASYPKHNKFHLEPEEVFLAALIMEIITSIRYIKSEYNLTGEKDIPVYYVNNLNFLNKLKKEKEIITTLSKIKEIYFLEAHHKTYGEITSILSSGELYLDLKNYLDIEREINRLKKEKEKIEEKLKFIEKKLSNPQFIEKAPQEIIGKEREEMKKLQSRLQKISKFLEDLQIKDNS